MAHLQIVNLPPGWKMEDALSLVEKDNEILIKIAPWLMKLLLGDKWPSFHGFNFDAVHSFVLRQDGTIDPLASDFDGKECEDLAPGPSFKLNISMIDDVFSPVPKIIPLRRK
jgi:hypothetical protein